MARRSTWILATLLVSGLVVGAVLVRSGSDDEGSRSSAPRRVEVFRPDDTTLEQCSRVKAAARVACRQQALANLAHRRDAGVALDALGELAREDPAMQAACHRVTHVIGAAALARTGSIDAALGEGSDLCISGYGHGVFETWVATDPDRARQLLAGDFELCTAAETPSVPLRHQCLHGTGHGIALLVEGDVPAGIAACERSFGADAKTCVGGLMMEVQYFERLDAGAGRRRCDRLAARWQGECWHARGAGAIARASTDAWPAAARACDEAPRAHRDLCAGATGEAAAELGAWDGARIVSTCRRSVRPAACADGALTLAARFAPDGSVIREICRAFALGAEACRGGSDAG